MDKDGKKKETKTTQDTEAVVKDEKAVSKDD